MKETIYLVGQVSYKEPDTFQWRKEVEDYVHRYGLSQRIEIVNPCGNRFDHQNLKTGTPTQDVCNKAGSEVIAAKCYNYVLRSSGAIANFNLYDRDRLIIGSFLELAWYYANPQKFVEGVMGKKYFDDRVFNHPMVRSAVDFWCEDHIEAIKTIENIFA